MILQDAAVARIAGRQETFGIRTAAENGDIELVRDLVIADPACVHETDEWCDARPLHTLLKTKAGLRFCFERCNSCLLFSGQTALPWSSMNGHMEVCKLLVEYEKAEADVGTETPP